MKRTTAGIELGGLHAAAGQRWGSVRLVPLLRASPRYDLRLALREYDEAPYAQVDRLGDGAVYCSYVPHGLVVGWGEHGEAAASWGAKLARAGSPESSHSGKVVQKLHGMVRRREDHALRLLPLHLALEGFLALCFDAPEVLWSEYSHFAARFGLGSTSEQSVSGHALGDLHEALRVFEVHDGQCGVLLYVGDDLASVLVTPNPEDYRALHHSLLEDVYGPTLLYTASFAGTVPEHRSELGSASPSSLRELRALLGRERVAWAAYTTGMAAGLLERKLEWQQVYKAGNFAVRRFVTTLDPADENHVGEAIFDERGAPLYLKTYRLSERSVKRAYLLQRLAQHGWELEAAARSFSQDRAEFVLRLERAGFGYLLHEHVLDQARAQVRRRG